MFTATYSHRVRTTLQRHSLVTVFLTDAKIHAKPNAVEPSRPEPKARPEPRIYVAPAPTVFDAMKDSLRAGVQVVSAPQLFPTPPALARRMVEIADVQPGECVLEPSAGTGNIVRAVVDAVDTEVLAYEINSNLAHKLTTQFPSYRVQARCADFLEVTEFQGYYPKILMNPPFVNGSDIRHILHARKFLAPGGRLVAICADGPRQRETLQPLALSYESLPAGTFADQGTNVNTAIVVLDAEDR